MCIRDRYEESLVSYSGPVEHVFTHCLIAYPEICYSSPEMMKSLDTDCLTPKEFTKIIQSLYDQGYILIDINSLEMCIRDRTRSVFACVEATV